MSLEKISPNLLFSLSLLISLAQILILFSIWRFLPPQVPLFYSQPWGNSQLANPVYLILLPAISLGLLVINLFLSLSFLKKELLGRYLFSSSALAVSFLNLISLIQIVRLVI